eukprot:188305_1
MADTENKCNHHNLNQHTVNQQPSQSMDPIIIISINTLSINMNEFQPIRIIAVSLKQTQKMTDMKGLYNKQTQQMTDNKLKYNEQGQRMSDIKEAFDAQTQKMT